MEIRQLEAFVAVAETGGFTSASERLNLTQSTVSLQIKALEEELGEALFVRASRQVRISDAGERLLPHARLALAALDEIAREFRASNRAPRGRLRVGAAAMATAYLLAPLYEGFIREYPDVLLLARTTTTTDETLRQVISGEIDVGFVAVPVANGALEVESVATDEVVLIVGCAHPWSDRTSFAARELEGESMIAFERGLSHRRLMDDLLAAERVTPRIVTETNDPQMVKKLVETGVGIALIPRWAVSVEVEAGRLCVLSLDGHALERDVNMVYLKRQTSAVRAFIEFCRRAEPAIRSRAEGLRA